MSHPLIGYDYTEQSSDESNKEYRKRVNEGKVHKVMKEFKEHKLHSGSKKGPEVKGRKQAIAVALSEARKGKK